MSSSHHKTVAALLNEGRWLRGLALALVRDPDDADDLMQDTIVAALERRPAENGSLRPWLKTVLSRLWVDRQRSDARRRARSGDPPAPEPAAADTLARFALCRQVAEAVSRLPEPYRTALLLRFYEDLPPRKVAARLGVPVETARTRIRRGLAMLRASLDRSEGSRAAWALPLIERVIDWKGASAATAGAWIGGVWVTSTGVFAVLLALAAITAMAAWGSRSSVPPQPSPGVVPISTLHDEMPSSTPGPDLDAVPRRSPTRTALPSAEVSPPGAASPPCESRVIGRCLAAESGAPLADCEVEFRFEKRPGPAVDGPGPVRTDDEGRFALAFATPTNQQSYRSHLWAFSGRVGGVSPPAPRGGHLWISAPGRVRLVRSFESHELEQAVDLGDVVVPLGSMVRGKLVDDRGTPVSNVEIGLVCSSEAETTYGAWPVEHYRLLTDETGRFEAGPIAGGDWDLVILERRMRILIPGGRVSIGLELVCPTPVPEDLIRGVVTDERGTPIPGANLRYSATELGANSDGEGRFQIERPIHEDGTRVRLQVTAVGFDTGIVEAAWGDHGLQISLRRGVDVDLLVRREDDGRPVEHFGIQIVRVVPNSAQCTPIRYDGRHEGGVLRVGGLPRGETLLVVVPSDEWLARSEPVSFTAYDGRQPLTVSLRRKVSREVTVLGPDGPIAGSRVELLRPPRGEYVSEPEAIEEFGRFSTVRPEALGIFWMAAETDADGRATLCGPGGSTFALQVAGPDHLPASIDPFVLTPGAEPCEIRVDLGRTLEVALVPAHVAEAFRARVGCLWLVDRSTGTQSEAQRFEENGTCTFAGLRDGDWSLFLGCRMPYGSGVGPRWSFDLGRVGPLGSGGHTARFAADLSDLEFAELSGTACIDGVPITAGKIQFRGRTVRDGEDREVFGGAVKVGADGSFDFELLPGVWTPVHDELRGEAISIPAGQALWRDLHFSRR